MKHAKLVIGLSAAFFAAAPQIVQAQASAEDIPGVEEGFRMPEYMQEYLTSGFENRNFGQSDESGEKIIEETPDGKGLVLRRDSRTGVVTPER